MFTVFNLEKCFLRLLAGGALLCLSPAGFAQQPPKPPQTDAPAENVSDSELRAFVKAYVDNQKIRQKYEPPLRKTTDPDKSKLLQDEATEELKKSLAGQKLSVENYNRIYNLLNSDEQLRKKALTLIEEERARSS